MDDLIERLRDERRAWSFTNTKVDRHDALARIAALEAELERRKYDGDHTCHEHCPRPACVLRREKAALEADNARLMGLVKEAGALLGAVHEIQTKLYGDATRTHLALSGFREPFRATLAKIKEATDAE